MNYLVRPMLYGFGDISNPRQDTVDLVEDCLLQYLSHVLDASVSLTAKRSNISASAMASLAAGPANIAGASTTANSSAAVGIGPSLKIKTEDVLTVLKRDAKKYGRAEELLYMNEELKRVRKAFDTDE